MNGYQLITFLIAGFGLGVLLGAWDAPAKPDDPFSPGNPSGVVVEPLDPCGAKQ